MRCPKCGYISFDHLETCKNCLKYIGDTVADINGTEYETVAPSFLLAALEKRQQSPVPESHETDQAMEMVDLENLDTLELREGIETEFILPNEAVHEPSRKEISLPESGDELLMDLDDFSEASPREEYSLNLTEKQEDSDSSLPMLDFGDLDISDLAPPVKIEEPFSSLFEEKQVPAEEKPVGGSTAAAPSPSKSAPTAPATGLADLTFSGLDLDVPSKLETGSTAGRRFLPSVKTGTALDKFDIDLGELFAENKK